MSKRDIAPGSESRADFSFQPLMTTEAPELNGAPASSVSANVNDTTSTASPDDSNSVRDQVASLDHDVARLSAVLSGASLTTSSDAELEGLDESSLATLLKQLEGADGVLSGVEDKLEGILGNLDALLEALEQGAEVKGGQESELKDDEKKGESENQVKEEDATRAD